MIVIVGLAAVLSLDNIDQRRAQREIDDRLFAVDVQDARLELVAGRDRIKVVALLLGHEAHDALVACTELDHDAVLLLERHRDRQHGTEREALVGAPALELVGVCALEHQLLVGEAAHHERDVVRGARRLLERHVHRAALGLELAHECAYRLADDEKARRIADVPIGQESLVRKAARDRRCHEAYHDAGIIRRHDVAMVQLVELEGVDALLGTLLRLESRRRRRALVLILDLGGHCCRSVAAKAAYRLNQRWLA